MNPGKKKRFVTVGARLKVTVPFLRYIWPMMHAEQARYAPYLFARKDVAA